MSNPNSQNSNLIAQILEVGSGNPGPVQLLQILNQVDSSKLWYTSHHIYYDSDNNLHWGYFRTKEEVMAHYYKFDDATVRKIQRQSNGRFMIQIGQRYFEYYPLKQVIKIHKGPACPADFMSADAFLDFFKVDLATAVDVDQYKYVQSDDDKSKSSCSECDCSDEECCK